MSRVVAVALALCACHRAPARIYTDEDLAKLETRVLAKVAETDASCSHQELADYLSSLDKDCYEAESRLERQRRPFSPMVDESVDTSEVAAVDEMCAAKVLTALGRAAVTSPGCSPYQVGVHAVPAIRPGASSFIGGLYANFVVVRHALRETEAYVGITELFLAIRVSQDVARGRVDLIQSMQATAMEGTSIAAAEKILSRASLTNEQLDDLSATLDATLTSEPTFGETLQGEAITFALHMGLAALKPKDWQPPGGRGELTSERGHFPSSEHDPRDDAGTLMAVGLRNAETFAHSCPASASLAACYASFDGLTDGSWDASAADKQAARVALYRDDATRHESQQQLVAMASQPVWIRHYLQKRAQSVARLAALRIYLQVLRDHRCPTVAQLGQSPYATLRSPTVLGDTLPITVKPTAITVDVPGWMNEMPKLPDAQQFAPKVDHKFQPVDIPCP